MYAYDVGLDESGCLVFRSELGVLSYVHPALRSGATVPSFTDDGRVTEPLWPPPDGYLVLAPERSGAWCYYNTQSGEAQWVAPAGSSSSFMPTDALRAFNVGKYPTRRLCSTR